MRGWGSLAFCLPFVSQRTWENCSLGPSGSLLWQTAFLPASPPPTLPPCCGGESRGGLGPERRLRQALKGSLCKGEWGGHCAVLILSPLGP